MPIILDPGTVSGAFVFKLGSLDLSSYLRVNPDDRMDPEGQPWVEPSFTETPFADGQPLVSTTVHNREQIWPVFLVDQTRLKDQLHALIRQINNAAAQRPLTLEWRDSGATFSTFYDVQFVRFEPDFNFRRSVHGYAGGVLHIWTNGFGHTGTTRVTATAAGTGVFLSVPVGSVAGDAPALLDTTIVSGAVLPSLGRIVALAPILQPSYTARIPAASLTDLQTNATLTGASGADGSQMMALPVSPTGGASGIACMIPLPNPTIAGGDNRILGMVKSGLDSGVAIQAIDPYGNAMGATAVASNSRGWSLVDLGVCRLPTLGFPTLPKISIRAGGIWASGAAGPAILASPGGLQVNEFFCLPDKNLTLLYERGVGASVIARDSFPGYAVLTGQNDSLGNPWSVPWNAWLSGAGSALSPSSLLQGKGVFEYGGFAFLNAWTGATSYRDGAHQAGLLSDSMLISIKTLSAATIPLMYETILSKDTASGAWAQLRFAQPTGVGAGGFLALEAATAGTLNLIASTGLPTLSAYQSYRMSLRLAGQLGIGNVTRDDGGPVFPGGASSALASVGASSAALGLPGVPGLMLTNGPSIIAGQAQPPVAYAWEVDTLPSSNLQPFDSYRVDGPNADSYRTSSAGVFAGQKLVSVQRGAFPKMVPSTVSLAVVCAPVDQGAANDLISAVVSVKERYIYGR